MIFGIEIDRDYLHTMKEYRDINIEDITPAMMAKVALQNKSKYQGDAEKRQAELKGNYGVGVCVLVRIYNATGEAVNVKTTADFRGHLGSDPLEQRVPNGTWTVFIHTKTAGAAVGSAGAVVYRTSNDGTELFAGWQNPWNRSYDSQVYVEVRGPGHWWKVGNKVIMLDLLDNHGGQSVSASLRGFTIQGSTGNETTAYVDFALNNGRRTE